jgi:colicin import membrane protein
MRPVEYKTEDIIQAGLELQALGRKVSGFSLRQKLGGGNTKRLKQVWDEYLTSKAVRIAEPATELSSEIAEAVTVVAKALTENLLALAIVINDKAVKAAECRVKGVIRSVEDQREQAERELADAQAVIQSQNRELAKLQERLALTEQTEKTESEQHAAELERLRNEFNEQKNTNQISIDKNNEADKQTAITREEAAILTGQLEVTKASTAKPRQVPSDQQTGIKNKGIDSRKNQVPNPDPY